MIHESSKRNINKIKDLARRQEYTRITKDCEMFMHKPNGNMHWLCKNKILTEWANLDGHLYLEDKDGIPSLPLQKRPVIADSFESWTFPDSKSAKEHFDSRSFDKDW